MATAVPARDDDLRFLKGVGPAKAAALAAAGIRDAWDLLWSVPRPLGPPPPLAESGPLPGDGAVRLRARLLRVKASFRRGRGMGVEAALERADGRPLLARFFNASWLRTRLVANEWYLWEGRPDPRHAGTLLHPAFVHLPQGPSSPLPPEPAVRVAYRLPEGFSERTFATLVAKVLDQRLAGLDDPLGALPAEEFRRHLHELHRPSSPEAHAAARRVLAQRELAAIAWAMQARRRRVTGRPGRAFRWSDDIHARALARLPFALTGGQQRALAEIRADARAEAPMYRLLQGDVGTGKTALALVAALAVIADGAQALVLAPTAVLAEQHAAFVRRRLEGSRVRLGLLTGGTPASERAELLARAAAGDLDLLLGTHALLEDDVRLPAAGLIVIDEQHKFGVAQRAALVARSAAAWAPDLLLLTATPIPRTLALTAFGDLAVSRIAERPPGRAPVTTEILPLPATGRGAPGVPAPLLAALRQTVDAGGRAFVICALRESGDDDGPAPADAATIHGRLAALFGAEQVGLLHGRMPEREKIAALHAFAAGPLRILVATTVVEVGIDVPEATLLAVLDAERFGLAQLHQLRGRLGRGTRPGRCLLLAGAAADRLAVLARSDDGQAVAEADLAERGPGALLGTDQHGLARLRIADLAADLNLLQDAHAAVRPRVAAGEAMPAGLRRLLPDDGWTLAGG